MTKFSPGSSEGVIAVPFTDRDLTCVDCGATFVFSADDQAYHQERGFTNEPRRCPSCRAARRAESRGDSGGGYGGGAREMFHVTCSECGKDAEVPFQPRGDRPVYCSDCFRKQRGAGGGGGGRESYGGGGRGGGGGGGGYGRRW